MCGVSSDYAPVVGHKYRSPACECLRPEGHAGEHATKGFDGRFWAFWTDFFCTCEGCQSDYSKDWCQIHIEIRQREMGELMMSKELVIYDKWHLG